MGRAPGPGAGPPGAATGGRAIPGPAMGTPTLPGGGVAGGMGAAAWGGRLLGTGVLGPGAMTSPHISRGKASRRCGKSPGWAKWMPSSDTWSRPWMAPLSMSNSMVANSRGPQMAP
ncbi:hypothetical protein [Cystobacter fuscus]|nr:hypothetical protein [Cystobacter fuscus]